jgi:hypothetical protein
MGTGQMTTAVGPGAILRTAVGMSVFTAGRGESTRPQNRQYV